MSATTALFHVTTATSHRCFSTTALDDWPLLYSSSTLRTWRPSGQRPYFNFRLQCSSVSTTSLTNEFTNQLSQNGIQILGLTEEVLENTTTENETGLREKIELIRSMLQSMEDGEINASPYDTAWVALVEAIDGKGGPQFPIALNWISDNQLPDGSWGDMKLFEVHDRILNTLGCVIALKSWEMHLGMVEQGLSFIRENICKLGTENAGEHMTIGFEVAFPSLLEMAKNLKLDIPYESPIIQNIYNLRDLKLKRVPMDKLHTEPTSLLYSLEGMSGLDWEKLLPLKCENGSFSFSPSSTAYAYMQSKDKECLKYITNIIKKFNGGVPNVYPVDLFEHAWALDRIQKLGISRYFQAEIENCVNYIYRFWTDMGISWARNSRSYDIDDTAMAFRILRLHGVDVSSDVFKNFKRGLEFFCFADQSNQGLTGMLNLYKASAVMFSNEEILVDAKKFSSDFLHEKRERNEIIDKWIITKDLHGEVSYALDVPWYASLPRLETRIFLEQYGGENDVWIGKVLYRMFNVNNNTYLEAGKLDYNDCQAMHQREWRSIQNWYWDSGLHKFGLKEKNVMLVYYLASASIFEPDRWRERIAWTKTSVLIKTFETCFKNNQDQIIFFLPQLNVYCADHKFHSPNYLDGKSSSQTHDLMDILFHTLHDVALDGDSCYARNIYQHLLKAWQEWMLGSSKHNDKVGCGAAELLVRTINLCSKREELLDGKYEKLMKIFNRVCDEIHHLHSLQEGRSEIVNLSSIDSIELDMKKLVESVLINSPGDVDTETKKTFLHVARSFYYTTYFTQKTIDSHITKVLFERVE